ncbi:MAG: hypothetical protein K0U98_27005 [Deltaproteobacteria bacterium]|nr:hypothetical protein [Deltaproteobacteria bacterium]
MQDLIWSVLGRFGDERLETRLEDFGVNSWGVTTDQLQTLWSDAKAELGIPEVSPAKIDLERYLPVGGQTAD